MKAHRHTIRHFRFVALLSAGLGYLADIAFNNGVPWFVFRMLIVGMTTLLAFEVMAKWPSRIRYGSRWVYQVVIVACVVPLTTTVIWSITTSPDEWPFFWRDGDRLMEFGFVTFVGLLVAPWVALGALVQQKETFAKEQKIYFELNQSRLERQEQEARLQLLQAQVSPHFLFNTLANVQALVDAGSPRASHILRTLTKYLRTAVPRMSQHKDSTLQDEIESVRAYLELMEMRMPDRLKYLVSIDAKAEDLLCPPLAILTLVENAVRHGIDPSEDGGRIDVHARRCGDSCTISVRDTGIGKSNKPNGSGTGLQTLRARLDLAYGGKAFLRLEEQEPFGFLAEIEFPAQKAFP